MKAWIKFYPSWVKPNLEYPKIPLSEIFRNSVNKHPNHIALIYYDARITYKQLDEYVNKCARALNELGLHKGDRVALCLPNIPQYIIAFFGILRAGGIAVPCNPFYKERELEYQINDAGAKIIVTLCDKIQGFDACDVIMRIKNKTKLESIITTSMADFLTDEYKKRLRVERIHYDNTYDLMNLIKDQINQPLLTQIEFDEVALLQYTGGTTGIPKGAMLTHYNLVSNAVAMSEWLKLKNDICLGVLPFFHIYGLTVSMNASLYSASTLILIPRFDAKIVMEIIERERVTVFCGVPTMYIALINHPDILKYNLSSLRVCVSGGAPLPSSLIESFKRFSSAQLIEGYGLTEASPVTHCNPLGFNKPSSIGIPIPDTEAKIVDLNDPLKELKVGEIGELAVRGPQVMKGYWNKISETELVLKNGWLLTGDIAKMDEDGYFYIIDRKKDMINVSGLKVWPREVEDVLYEHPAVKEVAVIGVADPYKGESVKAYVVLKDGYQGKVTENELIAFCRERIANYKVPKLIEFKEQLPKTSVGKVLRRALRELN
ncbi:MAG: long-chain fatty acid--CoA ligase [Nitrososphaerales archaeon]